MTPPPNPVKDPNSPAAYAPASKIKVKTRKGVARRFHLTATGKVMRRIQNRRHLRKNKSKKAIRN